MPPLIADESGASATSQDAASAASAGQPTGPNIQFQMGDGSTVTLRKEELEFFLGMVQTALLLYVVYSEVSG